MWLIGLRLRLKSLNNIRGGLTCLHWLGVSFVVAFAIGISWLASAFDSRIERKVVGQLPLPLDYPGSSGRRKPHTGRRPAMALVGFPLVLLSAAGAAILGRLANMQPGEAEAIFPTYSLNLGDCPVVVSMTFQKNRHLPPAPNGSLEPPRGSYICRNAAQEFRRAYWP